jgi:hypothetical protein
MTCEKCSELDATLEKIREQLDSHALSAGRKEDLNAKLDTQTVARKDHKMRHNSGLA